MKQNFKRNLTDEVLNLINKDLLAKRPVTEIAKTYNVSRKTIHKIKNGFDPKPRGMPKKYDPRKLKTQCKFSIKKLKKSKSKITAAKIKDNLSENVSLRTLQNFLKKDDDFRLRNIKRKIILSEKHKEQRVSIIRSWFNENVNFKNVIFSDECRFSLDGPDSFLSWDLFDGSNDGERPKRQFGGGGIMVYGAIASDGFFKLIKIEGTINSDTYLQLLKDTMLPIFRKRYGHNFIYQQDNARPHISKKMQEFFRKENIKVLSWPARSPDLSIIENVWKILKDDVYNQMNISNKDELWSRIESATARLATSDCHKIKNLYNNLVDKYLNVMKNNGNIK